MTIEKLPSGKYRISEMVGGVRYRKTVNFRPKQAEARRIIAELVETGETSVERMTVRQAIERYISSREAILSPSTIKYYKEYVKAVPDSFLNRQLSNITDEAIQKMINEISAGHSRKYVKNIFGLVRSSIHYFRPKYVFNVAIPETDKKIPYIPTENDVKRLMMAIAGSKYEIPIKLAVCGLRRSEICALDLADVGDDTVSITKAKIKNPDNEYIISGRNKTAESTRVVKIPKQLADRIRKQGYVYDGGPDAINHYLQRTLKRIGIYPFSLHKLRHYYASISHTLGVPDVYIMKSGGWKTDNIMKSVYRHALEDQTEKMEAPIIAHMGKLMKNCP